MEDKRQTQQMIDRCRTLAREAENASGTAAPAEFRINYAKMARHWTDLATELEVRLEKRERSLH